MPRLSIPESLSPGTIELLRSVAFAFREACEGIHLEKRMPSNMTSFPRGSCGICSEILGDYLISRGLAAAEYVNANMGQKSHAWIGVGNLVIDVTGDQFPSRPGVYVDVADAWIRKWIIDSRRAAVYDFGFRLLGENDLREETHLFLDMRFQLNELKPS